MDSESWDELVAPHTFLVDSTLAAELADQDVLLLARGIQEISARGGLVEIENIDGDWAIRAFSVVEYETLFGVTTAERNLLENLRQLEIPSSHIEQLASLFVESRLRKSNGMGLHYRAGTEERRALVSVVDSDRLRDVTRTTDKSQLVNEFALAVAQVDLENASFKLSKNEDGEFLLERL